MTDRIVLLHAYFHSMEPIKLAFAETWPEAEIINVLDESLYADISASGEIPDGIDARMRSILRHCELSGADGIVFTGSSFGPAVEKARDAVAVPVLKSDEAVAEYAVGVAQSILVICTARRALPVIRNTVETAARNAGKRPRIAGLVVAGAKDAIDRGDLVSHNRMIVEAARTAGAFEAIIFGQVSMEPAVAKLPADLADRVMTTPRASAIKMRSLLRDQKLTPA